jgi:hypothetical protein
MGVELVIGIVGARGSSFDASFFLLLIQHLLVLAILVP